MIPGQLIAPGQLTDLRVNFASVHGLAPVTRLAEVTFLHLNRTQNFTPGQE